MVDRVRQHCSISVVDREDKALQRCTLSARSMPGDGREHWLRPVLLPSHPSSGLNAKNLLSWGEAPNQAKESNYPRAVGHMSRLVVLYPLAHASRTSLSKALSAKHLRTAVFQSRPVPLRRATTAPQNGPCVMPRKQPERDLPRPF